jgi:hypothetical protein
LVSKTNLLSMVEPAWEVWMNVQRTTRQIERGKATPEQRKTYVGLLFEISAISSRSVDRTTEAGHTIMRDLLASIRAKGR